jgi:uncharacterized protein (DUF885 family)
MLNRRDLLLTAGAAVALPLAARADTTAEGAKLGALFEVLFRENLRQSPENATNLGLDVGENADLRSRLRDESAEGISRAKALNGDQLARLQTINREALNPVERVNYDTVVYTRRATAEIGAFDFGGSGYGPSPYVISQQTGAYQSVPDFLDTKHKIETAADADAYLARMEAFAVQLDQNTERQKHDAALGVIPPDFILDTTLKQLAAVRVPPTHPQSMTATPNGPNLLIDSLVRRCIAKGLPPHQDEAAKIYESKILPALTRQIDQVTALRARATHDAGVWHVKDGDAFYAAALKANTTRSMSPDEVHKLGLDQGREVSAKIDGLLKARGLTRGTVGERITALYKDPTSFFPNTDEGKAAAIAYCNARLDAIRPRLPRFFKRLPPYAFEVRRVPPATEAGAASAFSQGPALDGSRPGLVYFNLHDTAEWPKWSLPTTVFHEGLPGHQLEGGLALSNKSLPLIRKTLGFPGYGEGWALYAEQLADELGMYDDDPMGRIGYLRFQLFRCGRCVVDTGLHHMKWSREQAIQYFVDLDGDARGFATREVERYCVNPGQACAYKLGHTTFIDARARAQKALGTRFNIQDFHETGLNCGRVPLDILDQVYDAWIAAA